MHPRTRSVAYVGNFRPPHSTENHVAAALRSLGVTVHQFQEDDVGLWDQTGHGSPAALRPDFILWTHTHNYAQGRGEAMLRAAKVHGVPVVGYHLDRWWGLDRVAQFDTEPYFGVDVLITADGGHDDEWRDRGITHVWLPPGVAEEETEREGVFDPRFDYDVVFVGSWQNYHPEWPYRRELVTRLLNRYTSKRFRPICCNVRGQDLANVYATARVVVGDSCLAGGARRYWSDRIPETLGRGGVLVHPDVEGLDRWYTPGEDLWTYPVGNFDALFSTIDRLLADDVLRVRTGYTGRATVLARDLYRHRMRDVFAIIDARADLSERVGPVTVMNGGVAARFEIRRPGDGIVLQETWNGNQYGLTRTDVADRVVIDIGANIGDFAIWAAAAGARKVHAYEPDPANRSELHANLALNPDVAARVEVYEEAVWSKHVDLWMTDTQGRARVTDDAPVTLTGPERLVEGRRIDEVLIRPGTDRMILKMDCEGCEYPVIESLSTEPLERVDILVLEFHSGPDFGGDAVTPGSFGRLVTRLAEQGTVETFGKPHLGGMITWRRYNR